MKRRLGISFLIVLLFSSGIYAQKKGNKQALPLYKNSSAPIADRVNNLMEQMTIEEKVGQILCPLGWEMYEKETKGVKASARYIDLINTQHVGMFWATLRADPWTQKTLETGLNPELAAKATNALQKYATENTRLGIPILFAEECPHGHMAIGATVFPTSIGQSSTWDSPLIQKMATVIAKEARLQGGHIGYGPVLDLAREPRWSRTEETYGEDAVLSSRMGEAMVKGFQGTNINSGENVISTLKHFTAYGVPEGGHNGGSVSIGTRELHENYLQPFEAAVKAGALSVMTAYNSIDGIPCSSNKHLLTDVLSGDWAFKGFVVSDLGSIEGIKGSHKVAETIPQAAAMALEAGLDVDLGANAYKTLIEQIKKGDVDTKALDRAVNRVLRLKFEMGLFENPYVDPAAAAKTVRNTQHIALAREVAQKSIILLKNNNNTLPLSKDKVKHIAVIGPNADNMYNQLGDYTAPQDDKNIVTVLAGIKNKVTSSTKVSYVKGCAIRDTSKTEIEQAVELAKQADISIVVVGGSSARDFKTKYIATGAAVADDNAISDMESGEGFDRATLDLLGKQYQLLQAVAAVGKPIIVVYIQGRPLNMNWADQNASALINAWYPGQEGGNAIADVIFGDYNPAGRLPISVPRSEGQLPVYYNKKNPKDHQYIEMSATPLYTFGYGLSYTQFEYSNLQTNVNGNSVDVQFTVKNTGNYDGEEVVQLYLQDDFASVVRPQKQLKHFSREFLKKGEIKNVTFKLSEKDLSLLNQDMKWVVEPGTFTINVGASSNDIRLINKVTIK